ncbi:MAG TPA: c-type cytochrome [Arachidicoccus sp.]|nr:c-type cytochrome [Arachidicoccus sp.]
MRKRKIGYRIAFVMLGLCLIALTFLMFVLPAAKAGKAPELTVRSTPELIQRGKYLANHVAICMDCHSSRDWSRYSGPPIAGTFGAGGEVFNRDMGFPGVFYSKNITPAHLRDWSDGDILHAFTAGVNKQGKALFPIMPYLYYNKMDPEDAYAIIAYLRTLNPIDKTVPDRVVDFPMDLIINTIPLKTDLRPKPPKSDIIAYGGYLTMVAGCAECHTREKNGQIVQSLRFGGGRAFKMPDGILYSANITPDPVNGIGKWTASDFVKKFKFYADMAALGKLKPGDKNTVMPWSMYSGMDTTDLQAIYAYLHSIKPIRLSNSAEVAGL